MVLIFSHKKCDYMLEINHRTFPIPEFIDDDGIQYVKYKEIENDWYIFRIPVRRKRFVDVKDFTNDEIILPFYCYFNQENILFNGIIKCFFLDTKHSRSVGIAQITKTY